MGIHSSRPLFRKGQRRSTAGAAGPAASQCGKGHGHHFCPIQIRGTEFPLRPDGLALRVICSPVRGTLRFPSARGAGSPPTALLPLRRQERCRGIRLQALPRAFPVCHRVIRTAGSWPPPGRKRLPHSVRFFLLPRAGISRRKNRPEMPRGCRPFRRAFRNAQARLTLPKRCEASPVRKEWAGLLKGHDSPVGGQTALNPALFIIKKNGKAKKNEVINRKECYNLDCGSMITDSSLLSITWAGDVPASSALFLMPFLCFSGSLAAGRSSDLSA